MNVRLAAGVGAAAAIGVGAGAMLKVASGSDSMSNPLVGAVVVIGGMSLAGRGGAVATGLIAPAANNAMRIGMLVGLGVGAATFGALTIRDEIRGDDSSRTTGSSGSSDSPASSTDTTDHGSPLDGAVLGTLTLHDDSGGGTATARIVRDLPGSFATRGEAMNHVTQNPDEFEGQLPAIVGVQQPGATSADWHLVEAEVIKDDGTELAMDKGVLYDAFIHPDPDTGRATWERWQDAPGDGIALAAFNGPGGGFLVPMRGETERIDFDNPALPPGS